MFLELKFLTFTGTKPNLWFHLSRTLMYAITVLLNDVRNQNLQGFQVRKYGKFLNDMNVSHEHSF